MARKNKNIEESSVYSGKTPVGCDGTHATHCAATFSFRRAAAALGGAPLRSAFAKFASRFTGSSTGNAYNHRQPK